MDDLPKYAEDFQRIVELTRVLQRARLALDYLMTDCASGLTPGRIKHLNEIQKDIDATLTEPAKEPTDGQP